MDVDIEIVFVAASTRDAT